MSGLAWLHPSLINRKRRGAESQRLRQDPQTTPLTVAVEASHRCFETGTCFARIVQASESLSSWHPRVHGALETICIHQHAVLDLQQITFELAGRIPNPIVDFELEVQKAILQRRK